MNLILTKPLAVFDLETTSVVVSEARIVEIAVKLYLPDGTMEQRKCIVDPECEIPKAASDIHKITNQAIADLRAAGTKIYTFKQIASGIMKFIGDADLLTYNGINFDIPVLMEEFERAGLVWDIKGKHLVDSCNIFKKHEPRDLTAAMKFYCNETFEDAHSAFADIEATEKVLFAQVTHYPELTGMTIEQLAEESKMDDRIDLAGFFIRVEGKAVFAFGKHKGKHVAAVFKSDHSYYKWIAEKSDMTADTKRHATNMYKRANPGK